VELYPTFRRNGGYNSTDYTASYPRIRYSSKPPLWKPQILHGYYSQRFLWWKLSSLKKQKTLDGELKCTIHLMSCRLKGDNAQFNLTITILCDNFKEEMKETSQRTIPFEHSVWMVLQYESLRATQKAGKTCTPHVNSDRIAADVTDQHIRMYPQHRPNRSFNTYHLLRSVPLSAVLHGFQYQGFCGSSVLTPSKPVLLCKES
jgi:hypothetical protein